MAQTRVMFNPTPIVIPPYHSPYALPSGMSTPSSDTTTSSFSSFYPPSLTDAGILSATKSGESLLFMRRIGEIMRSRPQEVIAEVTAWLLDSNSPRYWRSFAYSLRANAREELGQFSLAREDYSEGLRLFDELHQCHGSAYVQRLRKNATFMESRVKRLGGRINFVVLSPSAARSFW